MYSEAEEIRTRESIEERDFSQQNQTYYYSKFQLFEDHEEIGQFYQYSLFLEKISAQLGQEWKDEANILYQPHFNSRDIFMILLSIWLHHHPVVNTINSQKQNKCFSSSFNQNYLENFNNRILEQVYSRGIANSQNFKIKKTNSKAICMGFFLTANQIWTEMFQKPPKIEPSKFNILKGVTKKIQQSFQPLMIVTQKISNLFGRKKVKKNDDIEGYGEEKNGQMFEDCYHSFKKTVDLEKQLVRKMSDFSLEDVEEGDEKMKKKTYSKKEFKDDESPVQKTTLGNFYQYITKYLKTKYPWQVANSFVTNILDVTQLQTQSGAKIKVMKPAQDFYEKLIIVWLTLQKDKKKAEQINLEEYINNVKCSFSLSWKQKYLVPIRYFYEKIMRNWKEISQETEMTKLNDEEKVKWLIKKVRENMKSDWEKKIKIEKKKKEIA